MRVRQIRKIKDRIVTSTIEEMPSRKFFVSVCCLDAPFEDFPVTGKDVGVNLGIKNPAITSDGRKYGNVKALEKNLRKLVHLRKAAVPKDIGAAISMKSSAARLPSSM